MRFADMMSRISQQAVIRNEPIAPDDVIILKPRANPYYGWLAPTDESPTPDKINGVFANSYIREARPLPREFFPASISFGPYKFRLMRESRRKSKAPVNVPQVMPDFYQAGPTFMISSVAREFFEQHCPGAIEYIEVDVKTPAEMIRAPRYYFVNVLTQAQMVDWPRVDRKAFALDRFNPLDPTPLAHHPSNPVPFKPFKTGDPLIWHEVSLDKLHKFVQMHVLVRGQLWNLLIKEFYMQFEQQLLAGRKIITPS